MLAWRLGWGHPGVGCRGSAWAEADVVARGHGVAESEAPARQHAQQPSGHQPKARLRPQARGHGGHQRCDYGLGRRPALEKTRTGTEPGQGRTAHRGVEALKIIGGAYPKHGRCWRVLAFRDRRDGVRRRRCVGSLWGGWVTGVSGTHRPIMLITRRRTAMFRAMRRFSRN